MNNYVARANIDHFLDMLHNNDVPAHSRSTITRLLIEEENKLSHDQEQLQFAESKAAVCRNRADRQRRLMDSFNHGSTDWELAERLLVNFESLAQFVEGFCLQMRNRVNRNRL
jgi:hypothetical protein